MYVVAVLLVVNMLTSNYEVLGKIYTWLYLKVRKPKFSCGEFVMINNREFEIIFITKAHRPYTYFCIPVQVAPFLGNYYHEKEIAKKTGVLKELE
jgi:hypothetical protein